MKPQTLMPVCQNKVVCYSIDSLDYKPNWVRKTTDKRRQPSNGI